MSENQCFVEIIQYCENFQSMKGREGNMRQNT